MSRKLTKVIAVVLATVFVLSLAACSGKGKNSEVPDSNKFTWWLADDDAEGTYYTKYEENTAVQWLTSQYWNKGERTIGTKDNGEKVQLSFAVPVEGTQKDSFTTMIATNSYPEIIDLNYADSINTLVDDGVLMEITDYVEKYVPNYVAFFEKNPELKKFACETDENGKDHYYKLACFSDYPLIPWAGFTYRRDWLVKYAIPTEYVWDWDSDYVKANGRPEVTPLSTAQSNGNLNGWKKNTVTAFSKTEGSDPKNDYEDNVIFPSGKTDPYTISDWEWMFEAFSKAIKERGFDSNSNAYCVSVYYPGYESTGELVSSFGGCNGTWYKDENGVVSFTGDDDNFKTYIECMNTWYKNGWLDKTFETRSSDMFFAINSTGFSQGMVGLAYSLNYQGDTIRATCTNSEDKADAYVMPCALPINDVYGTDAQKFHTPDSFYQDEVVDNSPVGFTNKCEGKNLEVLFSMFNWMYSPEGQLFTLGGLSEEQYKSMEFSPDLYATLGIASGYKVIDGANGEKTMATTVNKADAAFNAIRVQRLSCQYVPNAVRLPEYAVDYGFSKVVDLSNKLWTTYVSTGSLTNYIGFFSEQDAQVYNKTNTYITDYMSQAVPQMIKGGLGDWDSYVKKLAKFAPDKVSAIFQKYID
jgi:ABC-type glycerol-3-phosphate transport system substrate-binding protein